MLDARVVLPRTARRREGQLRGSKRRTTTLDLMSRRSLENWHVSEDVTALRWEVAAARFIRAVSVCSSDCKPQSSSSILGRSPATHRNLNIPVTFDKAKASAIRGHPGEHTNSVVEM